jgi:membrane-associated phospholipid phosphatase
MTMNDRRWTIFIARWLSIVAHPFVMVGVMVGVAASGRSSAREAARSVLIVLAFTLVPLLVLMVRQVRVGAWKNVDASNANERPVLYLVGGVALTALLAYLAISSPQSYLVRGSVGTLAMLAACAVATRWVKVSLHVAFGALAATTLLMTGSVAGWVLLPLVPALAWSRLLLARHRPLEVALGTLMGFSAGLAVVLF